MIISFLDLLGFSNLVKNNQELAYKNMVAFNSIIDTKFMDDIQHPINEYYEKNPNDDIFLGYVKYSSVTSFKNLISFSDSLIIGSDEIDVCVRQLASLLLTLYIKSSQSIKNDLPFALLFRGGISEGEDVRFDNRLSIIDGKCNYNSRNVFGQTYLKAVKLEKSGKGPRLFCDKSVVISIKDKSLIKSVDVEKEVYEIVWTASNDFSGASYNKWDVICKKIDKLMLPPALKLYKHYQHNIELELHYNEFIKLVSSGILKNAKDECNKAEEACELINQKIKEEDININIDPSILEEFLE